MNLRREIGIGLGSILVLQLLSVLLALTLLARMAPAIEQIRRENVYSSEAVEVMLASLVRVAQQRAAGDADNDDVVVAREVAAFDLALLRAEDNIAEKGERPALAIIRAQRQQAFAGDALAWETLVEQLRKLGDINRASMASPTRSTSSTSTATAVFAVAPTAACRCAGEGRISAWRRSHPGGRSDQLRRQLRLCPGAIGRSHLLGPTGPLAGCGKTHESEV